MTPTPPDRALRLSAIIIALTVFVLLHVLLLFAARALAATPERIATIVPILNAAAYLIYLIAGFVAGAIARSSPILHGITTGLFATLIAIIFFGAVEAEFAAVAILIANGLIFGGIGGASSLLLAGEKPAAR